MRNLTSRQKIMLGVYAMILAMAGDYLLGLGQLTNFIMEGLDSGAESFGCLTLYLVCALSLVGKEEKV